MFPQVMNCWPSSWIAAAKKAGLAHGMDASTGQFFIPGGDAMRHALEVFAQEIYDAAIACERREAWEAVNKWIKSGDLGGNGCDNNATRNGLILASNELMSRIHEKPNDL